MFRLVSSVLALFVNANKSQIEAADLHSERDECGTIDPIHTRPPILDVSPHSHANHQKYIRFGRKTSLSVSTDFHFPRIGAGQYPFDRCIAIAPNFFTTRSTALHLFRKLFKSSDFLSTFYVPFLPLRASLPKHLRIARNFFRRLCTDGFRDLVVGRRTEIHRSLHICLHVCLPPSVETFA